MKILIKERLSSMTQVIQCQMIQQKEVQEGDTTPKEAPQIKFEEMRCRMDLKRTVKLVGMEV